MSRFFFALLTNPWALQLIPDGSGSAILFFPFSFAQSRPAFVVNPSSRRPFSDTDFTDSHRRRPERSRRIYTARPLAGAKRSIEPRISQITQILQIHFTKPSSSVLQSFNFMSFVRVFQKPVLWFTLKQYLVRNTPSAKIRVIRGFDLVVVRVHWS